MTEPPTTEGPQRSTLVALGIGAVVAIVLVLTVVLDVGLVELGLVLLPIAVVSGSAVLGLLWAKRRGHLD